MIALIVDGKKIAKVEELIESSNTKIVNVSTIKKIKPEETTDEQEFISKLQNDLEIKLKLLRTNRVCARSQIKLDPNNQVIEILRQIGKSRFRSSGEINFCKILFHFEMNQVEIYNKTLPLSLEEAYCLILNEEKSKIYPKYIINSILTRAGFMLRSYDENADYNDEQSYIWHNLFEQLGFLPQSNNCFELKKIEQIRKDFDIIKENTINSDKLILDNPQNITNENKGFKRKIFDSSKFLLESQQEPIRKREKLKGFDEETNNRIQYIFDKIKIEKVSNKDFVDEINKIRPDFDLYLTEKNNGTPDFRILIIEKEFPNINDLYRFYWKQKLRLPLICFNVEDTRNIQTFLLHF